jgi:hypothetical protein
VMEHLASARPRSVRSWRCLERRIERAPTPKRRWPCRRVGGDRLAQGSMGSRVLIWDQWPVRLPTAKEARCNHPPAFDHEGAIPGDSLRRRGVSPQLVLWHTQKPRCRS